MKRFLFLSCLLTYFSVVSIAFAQDAISVRGYEREDYSRLVFRLENPHPYTIEETKPGEVLISFKQSLTADLSNLDVQKLKTIGGIKILSETPLQIKVRIPPSSKIRDFKVGKRIMLDIYTPKKLSDLEAMTAHNVQGDAPPKHIAKVEKKPAEQATEHASEHAQNEGKSAHTPQPHTEKTAPAVQATPKAEEAHVTHDTHEVAHKKPPHKEDTHKEEHAVSPKIILVPEYARAPVTTAHPSPSTHKDAHETSHDAHNSHKAEPAHNQHSTPQSSHNEKKLAAAIEQKNHVISFTSTKSFSMAAFENHGNLWFVLSGTNEYTKPNLNTPSPQIFSGFERMTAGDDIMYKTKLPDQDLILKSKGGTLVWDLILGNDIMPNQGTKPTRTVKNHRALRNGKLLWPLTGIDKIIDFEDPITGQKLKVVTVKNALQLSGKKQNFVEFDILNSPIGMTIYPKVDDLLVTKTPEGIEISRKKANLSIILKKDIENATIFLSQRTPPSQANNHGTTNAAHDPHAQEQNGHHEAQGGHHEAQGGHAPSHGHRKNNNNLYKFRAWQLGTVGDINHNEILVLSELHNKEKGQKLEDLITLGKMMLSHARAAEALGYFDYAISELPSLEQSAELKALRGAARALDWKSEAALVDLSHKDLNDIDEIKFWKAYVLADLGDWRQAALSLPKSYNALYDYPYNIGHRLALSLAEVNLRDGNVKQADELLGLVAEKKSQMPKPMRAFYDYLRGESFRQKGEVQKTKEIWGDLSKSRDNLYRTKAGLALTILEAKAGKIDDIQTIDRLERLRYSWRGDELEANVNYWLGDSYFKTKNYIKGLTIMRDAASQSQNSVLSERITKDMADTFAKMYLGPALKDISALDAVAVYEEFRELTPVGDEGNKLVQKLAEHLVRADLLGRASKLLRYQVDHRLKGKEKLRIAIRLAAIELLAKNPQKAVESLGKAEDTLKFLSDTPESQRQKREIDLLRIRAYSQNKQFNKAMSLIEKLPFSTNVSRLKADVAWQAGYWNTAAAALQDVLIDEEIASLPSLSLAQAHMVLNRAIALNLDSDRVALANMRKKYGDLMRKTKKANQFELITRPRNNGVLADRETLMSVVSEVDLFKDFLETYKDEGEE